MTDMYNKLFTKILDSSIWNESTDTRIVWMTFIAAMDEEGMVRFASVQNVAHRARVPIEAAKKAIDILEGPDPDSSDQDNEGRRIERVPGGWMVLNGPKYRGLVTKSIIQEQTRERVRRHRERKAGNVTVTPVTVGNDSTIAPDNASASVVKHPKPKCPNCGVVGSLQRCPARNGNPAQWWCRTLKSKTFKGDGCGENFPVNHPAILSQLTPFLRKEILSAHPLPARSKTFKEIQAEQSEVV